jgi:cell division control protein 24
MSSNTRKKSVTSSSGIIPSSVNGVDAPLHIDTPVAMNTMLNKQATTSLYQQCVVLRNRLLHVHDFAPYLDLIERQEQLANLDVVHRLWHTLALGVPLCFLFNLLDLPITDRIQVSTDPEEIDLSESDPEALKAKKRAAALFIIGIQKLKKANLWSNDVELFTVTELTGLDNKDTNGFVKVVATTSHLLDKLPEHVWKPQSDTPPQSARDEANRDLREGLGDDSSPPTLKAANAQDMDRNNIIRELIETERKYIQDLEVMHVCVHATSFAEVKNDLLSLLSRIMQKCS